LQQMQNGELDCCGLAPLETGCGIGELDRFIDRGLITVVDAPLTSGKEAAVYRCRTPRGCEHPFLAAKVYHEHAASGFRRNVTYFEGRERNLKARSVRAIRSGSAFGREALASVWVSAEYEVLSRLSDAGADTPRPVALESRAILMEYFGDGRRPAPQLHSEALRAEDAGRIWRQILENIEIFLGEDLVHGDLSPYNILLWDGRPRIIDVPQAVDARFNHSAFELLCRDIENVASFFAKVGVHVSATDIAFDLWDRYRRARL